MWVLNSTTPGPTMRFTTLLRILVAVQGLFARGCVLERQGLVVDVVPRKRKPRCSTCGHAGGRIHDRRERCWRHLDGCGMQVHLRYRIARIHCPRCEAVKTEDVAWARAGSGFTYAFEERVAYLAQGMSKTAVTDLMRIAWRTAGRIIERVVDDRLESVEQRLDGLRNIGVDEISYRKHHKYITLVVDHDRGVVVWAAEGKSAATLTRFFEDLGADRTALLESVTIDMSAAYIEAVRRCAPDAKLIFDRFHVQRLAHDALDATRRDEMRALPRDLRKRLKRTRWALQKSPWKLGEREAETLDALEELNRPIFRAYLLKEALVAILDRRQVNVAAAHLDAWLEEAASSGLAHFERTARTIAKHRDGILEYVRTRRNNGRVEGLNGKARVLTRRAYGFHSSRAFIALLFLCCGGVRVTPAFSSPLPTH